MIDGVDRKRQFVGVNGFRQGPDAGAMSSLPDNRRALLVLINCFIAQTADESSLRWFVVVFRDFRPPVLDLLEGKAAWMAQGPSGCQKPKRPKQKQAPSQQGCRHGIGRTPAAHCQRGALRRGLGSWALSRPAGLHHPAATSHRIPHFFACESRE